MALSKQQKTFTKLNSTQGDLKVNENALSTLILNQLVQGMVILH